MTTPSSTTAHPISTPIETMARETFQTLLAALSNPGCIFTLSGPALSTQQSCRQIGLTLLDLETSFFTSDHMLRRDLDKSGARFRTASSAAYLFFPDGDAFEAMLLQQTLDIIAQATVGTIVDPDEGATILVSCGLDQGRRLHLRGPGIQHTRELRVDHLPVAFWQLRAAKINYPLGIDLFLVDGVQVVGLPRTTTIEIE